MKKTIIKQGDFSGNRRIVRFRLPSGIEIISFPTENPYGGEWDLGPTWNYVVMGERRFLVDTGRWGQGGNLLAMMKEAGLDPKDLEFVLITHGHEDHDGGLSELVALTDLKVKAHVTYDILRKPYPDLAPQDYKRYFPAKCWRCFMPKSFYTKNCLGYHAFMRGLSVETIGDGSTPLGEGIEALHLPGHSPDCLAVMLGGDGIIVGDTVLPDITPWPTSLEMFDMLEPVLAPRYTDGRVLFGLGRYIKSLHQLLSLAESHPGMAVFAAHRMYYNGRWSCINLKERTKELLGHHLNRCSAILDLVSSGFTTVDEIVVRHFEESKLKGAGIHLARNEIISHCELLKESHDLVEIKKHVYSATGSSNFEDIMRADPI